MDRYICIHGHFYQPPRENPWLEVVEIQDSAYPFHDWNQRITDECYAPNTASRILDGEGRIQRIVNNYARISFNFGPTLLAWLAEHHPQVYQAVLEADKESQQRFSGHGSAMAQAYNHMIMPLANDRDRYTQALWGIRDFQHRFGRMPEGMWLPETAVDLATLEVLAELGIRYTILSPYQAGRVRRLGTESWQEVAGGRIDPTRAYLCRLPSGRSINLFFYDGPISQAVAFEGLLNDGKQFAHRLAGGFSDRRDWPQILHIATDGESYGHHHRHGDMALAYALAYIEEQGLARLTNYGEYLERFPPTHEVEILEWTSWSCAHGVERWRNNCGCRVSPDLSQGWRAPLREALDWLRDTLAPRYEQLAGRYLRDPWAARNDYIDVVLDRSRESRARFLAAYALRDLTEPETVTVLKLLELQRHAMLMYTSCGWFFDELSGIETVQILQYAGRAVQLAEELFGPGVEAAFLLRLGRARSNFPELRDGRQIYERFVQPAVVDLQKVGAHYAVRSLFEEYAERDRVCFYQVERQELHRLEVGRTRLAAGRVRVQSQITLEGAELAFAALHFGDHNLIAGVRDFRGQESYEELVSGVTGAFNRFDLPEVLRLIDQHFKGAHYSLQSLFRDEQRRILNRIMEATLAEVATSYRQIYQHHGPLMRYLSGLGTPLPRALRTAAEFVLTEDLRQAFADPEMDLQRVANLLNEAGSWQIELDGAGLSYALGRNIKLMTAEWQANPGDKALVQRLVEVMDLVQQLPFRVDLWHLQNVYYDMLQRVLPERRERAEAGSAAERAWVKAFVALGHRLRVRGGA